MSDSKDLQKKLYFNASWLFGGKTASGIFTAIQTVVVARLLGVSDYGWSANLGNSLYLHP